MKYLFCILLFISPFALCQTSGESVFAPLNLAETSANPVITELMNFGVQAVVSLGIERGILVNSVYEIAEVYSVGYHADFTGQSYKFEVRLADDQLNAADVTFVVFKPKVGELVLTFFSFESRPVTPSTPSTPSTPASPVEEMTFTDLNVTEAYTDPEIAATAQFGLDYSIAQGIQEGILVDTQYRVTFVSAIGYSPHPMGKNDKFELDITDLEQNAINTTYIVFTHAATGVQNVLSYTFSPWIVLDVNGVTNNETLSNIELTGLEYVLAMGVERGIIPSSDFAVTELISFEEQNVETGWNYRWIGRIGDSSGNTAKVVFITFYDPNTGTSEVFTYWFEEVSLV